MVAHGTNLCTFHLGPYVFGVDVAFVQEVLVHPVITPVPLTPPLCPWWSASATMR